MNKEATKVGFAAADISIFDGLRDLWLFLLRLFQAAFTRWTSKNRLLEVVTSRGFKTTTNDIKESKIAGVSGSRVRWRN